MNVHLPASASQSRRFQAVNPANGDAGLPYPGHSLDEALAIIDRAEFAFESWRRTHMEERAFHLRRAAQLLRERSDEFAILMAQEMGKPISTGEAEIEKCATHCDYFAGHAQNMLADELVPMPGELAAVTFAPLGVILAVMPWNYPFWQVIRFAAPALMAGNTAVLKHAANVPGSALALERLFLDAGFPEGVFGTALIGSGAVADLISHPAVAAVTLTGSVAAGRAVAAEAGKNLKKCVLELGGSDPYLVLADADIPAAARICATARMNNGGQSCNAGKRFIVERAVLGPFEEAFTREMLRYRMGDPLEVETNFGPLVSVRARDQIHDQVERSIAAGARLVTGGVVPERPGAWYPPTILADVRPGQPAYHEEIFGPVAAIIAADDADHAIRIANDSEFGLGAAVFTQDLGRGERIARHELIAGTAFVNGNVRSDSRLPFGGVRSSGYGRECSSYGLREFVNIKTVRIREPG